MKRCDKIIKGPRCFGPSDNSTARNDAGGGKVTGKGKTLSCTFDVTLSINGVYAGISV